MLVLAPEYFGSLVREQSLIVLELVLEAVRDLMLVLARARDNSDHARALLELKKSL